MPDDLAQPHDNLFRAVFGEPAEAAGLLRAHLPPEVADGLDWSTLTVEESDFFAPELRATESDLLYSTNVLATQEEQIRQRFAKEFQRQVPGPRGDTMNYVEEIKQESRQAGRQEGRQEGRVEGQVRTIESLLRAGAPWPLIESATGIDEAGLRALKQRLTASSAANGAVEDTG